MNKTRLVELLEDAGVGGVQTEAPLQRFTTYRLGGPALVYVEPSSLEELISVGRAISMSSDPPVQVLPLGRGSNLVISDQGFDGLVVRLASFTEIETTGETGVRAGAGVSLPVLANWAARRGLGGLEFGVGVPGSVGGAVRMNAGAHGQETAQTVREATVVDLHTGTVENRPADSLGLSYRHSDLLDHEVVVAAAFDLVAAGEAQVRTRMEGYRRHRAETQPGALQNAGSTFKNPPGDSAGRLVEAAGLKGYRVGGVEVSSLHANFFVASDGASAQDVYDLVHEVKAKVFDAFGVELEPEVRFVGRFRQRVTNGEGAR